jgi:Zn finger protein HypA/HybF involved in hydrogenase expression
VSEVVEIQYVVCKACSIEKIRVKAGKFNAKDIRWVDESGDLWNGRICPDCHRENTRVRGILKRAKNA